MLSVIPGCYSFIDHQYVTSDSDQVRRLIGNVEVVFTARDFRDSHRLLLYIRENPAGLPEMGIIFSPGPNYCQTGNFPFEMLRVFASSCGQMEFNEDCFDFVDKYYRDLVAQENFRILRQKQ